MGGLWEEVLTPWLSIYFMVSILRAGPGCHFLALSAIDPHMSCLTIGQQTCASCLSRQWQINKTEAQGRVWKCLGWLWWAGRPLSVWYVCTALSSASPLHFLFLNRFWGCFLRLRSNLSSFVTLVLSWSFLYFPNSQHVTVSRRSIHFFGCCLLLKDPLYPHDHKCRVLAENM